MRRLLTLLPLLFTAALIYLLNTDVKNVPSLGKLLSPSHGIWQNGPSTDQPRRLQEVLSTPHGDVQIFYDDRRVPHIFAPSEQALYYAQGYVQAQDRLWQMDFQVRIAGGKLSEAIGEKGLFVDRYFRRIGIPKAADDIVAALADDTLYQKIVMPFTDGINHYITQLKERDLPIEFKLSGYQPDPWTLRKSILLLKLMAFTLSGSDTDVQNSNTLKIIDRAAFDVLFPNFPSAQSPIIPSGTAWNFQPVDFADVSSAENPDELDDYSYIPPPIAFKKGVGSNNWAVGSEKTKDGGAILCNDPHLELSYPSIWYEMQLNAPGLNVYGVTIPGSPCIIIGFNEQVAWGVTNGSRDVRDWYSVQYKDDTQTEYLFEGEYHPVVERIEVIHIKNQKDFIDTVKWTQIGPIVYDNRFGKVASTRGLAVRWLALDVSNELKTFYYLNRSENHVDYMNALDHYQNPAQNFVFADRKGNIAIREQGKFRAAPKDAGKFVEPLEKQSTEKLNTFIPYEHNPHVYNPKRGYVSSANQHPTDSLYPYPYDGWFERYRHRRINYLLDSLDKITVDDMKWIQNDTYNLMAAEMLPYLLAQLDEGSLSAEGKTILKSIKEWDHYNNHTATAPSYFQDWFDNVKLLLLDEFSDSSKNLRIPLDMETFEFLVNHPEHELIDNKSTTVIETAQDLIRQGYDQMVMNFGKDGVRPEWQYYNHASIEHLMKIKALGSFELPTGGNENAINAKFHEFGPSWRMIVQLNDEGVKGYGVYPGGQSGNPADPGYDAFVDNWMNGRYFDLQFYRTALEAEAKLKIKKP